MNRHERRKAEKLLRSSMNKQQMMMQIQSIKGLYEQTILEMEQLRRRAMATQLAFLSVLAHKGPIEVPDEVIEQVQEEKYVGWNSSESDNGIIFTAVEEDEDEAE